MTYFGGRSESKVAAFIAFIPSISVITLCTVYLSGGAQAAVSYAKSMLMLLPSWLLYVVCIILLLPRIGLTGSILISVAVYLGAAVAIMRLT